MGQILYADRSVPVASVDSDLTFYDGGRRLSGGGRIELTDAAGIVRDYTIRPWNDLLSGWRLLRRFR